MRYKIFCTPSLVNEIDNNMAKTHVTITVAPASLIFFKISIRFWAEYESRPEVGSLKKREYCRKRESEFK